MTLNPFGIRICDTPEVGMPVINEDISLKAWSRERRHQQDQRSLFIVPTITEALHRRSRPRPRHREACERAKPNNGDVLLGRLLHCARAVP